MKLVDRILAARNREAFQEKRELEHPGHTRQQMSAFNELALADAACEAAEFDERRCVGLCDFGHNHADHHEGVGTSFGMPGFDPVEPVGSKVGTPGPDPIEDDLGLLDGALEGDDIDLF